MRPAAAALVATLLLGGCSGHGSSTTTRNTLPVEVTTSSSAPDSPSGSSSARSPGLRSCPLERLPQEARDTAGLVVRGGPFPHRRKDGATYFNRNQALPERPRGVYREFTVRTPGASNRGARRLVTDGNPERGEPTRSPSAWYYTDDHYATFCSVTGAPLGG